MEYLLANSVSELVKRSDLLGLTDKDKIIVGTGVSLGLLTIILAIFTYLLWSWRRRREERTSLPSLSWSRLAAQSSDYSISVHSAQEFSSLTTRPYSMRRHSSLRRTSLYAEQARVLQTRWEQTTQPPLPRFYLPSVSRPPQAASPYDYQNRYPSRTVATSSANSVINMTNLGTTQSPSIASSDSNSSRRERTITVNINKDKKDFWIALGMLAATVLSAISAIVVPLVLKYT